MDYKSFTEEFVKEKTQRGKIGILKKYSKVSKTKHNEITWERGTDIAHIKRGIFYTITDHSIDDQDKTVYHLKLDKDTYDMIFHNPKNFESYSHGETLCSFAMEEGICICTGYKSISVKRMEKDELSAEADFIKEKLDDEDPDIIDECGEKLKKIAKRLKEISE